LREGSDVSLKFAQDLSSKNAADGDSVELVLAEDLTVNNVVIAKAETRLSERSPTPRRRE
jgi:hypothetical protein